ncbi:MAG TPA: ATP-binding SpoIIE family protein phosphatase [Streptosporangiaceae bacterium]|nr:ATP-binding SpoIIE family protein phosphatase [Streptosporangiaceae bacterium]
MRARKDGHVSSAITAEVSAVLSSASAQTLTLAIAADGRILQHDRGAADILSGQGDSLLGTGLQSLITGPGQPAETLRGLIEVTKSDRESTTVLTIRTANRSLVDAVVTFAPIRATDPDLAAQVTMRIPPPAAERFIDPALMRHALLDGSVRRIGGALDIEQMAPELVNILVPHFCNSAGLLMLETIIGDAEHPDLARPGPQLVRRLAVAYDDGDPGWEAAFPVGEVLRYPPESPYNRCMDTAEPVSVVMDEAAAVELAATWLRTAVSRLLSGASLLLLPVLADQTLLGFFVCTRRIGFHRFDAYDAEIGMEFASRAGLFMDNARKYSRERTTALTLQRAMLPTGLSAPKSVEVRHRYLPGSKLIEVGGDWYESIALPGGRVALVVGDVAGHGVRAAVTMGRLRTAIKTLTMLELPPAETLQRLDDLMHELGVFEPHFATCVYAIYDSVDGTCEVASAGHLPPLLVRPDGTSEFLDVSPAPPLGIGASPIISRTLPIDDGSLLVMYTDGLVEKRTEDIDHGLDALRKVFGPGSTDQPLEELCRAALVDVYGDHQRDDIAILIAKLRRIEAQNHVSWNLAAKLTAARRARSLIRRPLRQWGLAELIPLAELVVSELVTNAVRYAQSKIGLRLVLEGGLFCEVVDDSAALPRLRYAANEEERGRGLQVVSQLAQRWGTRRTSTGTGKIVWCELALPPARPPAKAATRNARPVGPVTGPAVPPADSAAAPADSAAAPQA